MGDHQDLWIDINSNRTLGFRPHDIITPISWNLCLEYPMTINKLNNTLHTRFVKHDIYQKIYYIHNRDIYPLPTHLAQSFEILDEIITRLMHASDKNAEGK